MGVACLFVGKFRHFLKCFLHSKPLEMLFNCAALGAIRQQVTPERQAPHFEKVLFQGLVRIPVDHERWIFAGFLVDPSSW